jgi:hypothetical protein
VRRLLHDEPGDGSAVQVFRDKQEIRRVQLLVVMLSCLPREGKCREVLQLALALDEGPALERIVPLGVPDPDRDLQPWLEAFWLAGDVSADMRELVWWQNSSDNMVAAVREIKAIQDRLEGAWLLDAAEQRQ